MIQNLLLHWQFVKLKYASRMAYRFDFFTCMFAFFLFQLSGPLFVGVIFYAGGLFPGWSFPQLLLLQGTLALIRGFSFMSFFGLLWNTQDHMRRGTFDLLLIRPVNSLWFLVMNSFDEEDSGQFIGGVAITLVAVSLLPELQGSLLAFFAILLLGVLFFLSLALLCSAATIIFIETQRLYEFIDIIMIFASYPKTIYSGSIAILFNTLIPLFVAGNYPASALLGFSLDGVLIAAVSVIGLLTVSMFIWHKTLRYYTSAGG
ncbi:MAG: ABC-2 family transporter protein [Candidatus Aenigmarchaeota archaeon]|nr:ABC-2 family transporter protein [Candidatus Aenigmarchaeota archaeon]